MKRYGLLLALCLSAGLSLPAQAQPASMAASVLAPLAKAPLAATAAPLDRALLTPQDLAAAHVEKTFLRRILGLGRRFIMPRQRGYYGGGYGRPGYGPPPRYGYQRPSYGYQRPSYGYQRGPGY